MLSYVIYVLTALEVLVAILLIGLILIQKSKSGGGLGGISGGGATEEVFGGQASSVLVKATVFFSLIFLVNTLALGVLHHHTRTAKSDFVEKVRAGAAPVQQVLGTEAAPDAEAPASDASAEPAAAPAAPAAPAPAAAP